MGLDKRWKDLSFPFVLEVSFRLLMTAHDSISLLQCDSDTISL